jgi:2-dehydropantoate 2-reductase
VQQRQAADREGAGHLDSDLPTGLEVAEVTIDGQAGAGEVLAGQGRRRGRIGVGCGGGRLQLAEAGSPAVRRVPVPVVEHPAGAYDLIAVFVRTHQADAVLESLADLEADVLFALNWAAGPEPLGAVIGHERVLLSFPTNAGTMDVDVVRYRPANFMTHRVPMPVGEPDGRATPRLERIVRAFRTAGINAKAEPQMDAWLKTHAAFAVPLGQAVHAAGDPVALAADPGAVT